MTLWSRPSSTDKSCQQLQVPPLLPGNLGFIESEGSFVVSMNEAHGARR